VQESRAEVVMLRPWKQLTRKRCELLSALMNESGLRPVRPDLHTNGVCDLYLLTRDSRIDLVRRPTQRH
jgi:hypothetical protein